MTDQAQRPGAFAHMFAGHQQPESVDTTWGDVYDALPGAAYEMNPAVWGVRAGKALGNVAQGEAGAQDAMDIAGVTPFGKLGAFASGAGKAMFVGLPALKNLQAAGKSIPDNFLGTADSLSDAKSIWKKMRGATPEEMTGATWANQGWAHPDTFGVTRGPYKFQTGNHYADGSRFGSASPFTWMRGGNLQAKDNIRDNPELFEVGDLGEFFRSENAFDALPGLQGVRASIATGHGADSFGSVTPRRKATAGSLSPEDIHMDIQASSPFGAEAIANHEAQHIFQGTQNVTPFNDQALMRLPPATSKAMEDFGMLADLTGDVVSPQALASSSAGKNTRYLNAPWEKQARESATRHRLHYGNDLDEQRTLLPGNVGLSWEPESFWPVDASKLESPLDHYRLAIDPKSGAFAPASRGGK